MKKIKGFVIFFVIVAAWMTVSFFIDEVKPWWGFALVAGASLITYILIELGKSKGNQNKKVTQDMANSSQKSQKQLKFLISTAGKTPDQIKREAALAMDKPHQKTDQEDSTYSE